MSLYYADDTVTLHHGHALEVLAGMPDESVDCVVTSPPYYGLRSYLDNSHPDKAHEYGAEESPAEYVGGLQALFAEVRRVLTADGTLWLNLGDSYSVPRATRTGAIRHGAPPAKNLMGMPWRVAFALQDDGWILRNDIIWAKPNGMPESVTDRLSTKHEHVFMFAKSRRYWFDLDAIREPAVTGYNGSEFHTGKTGEHQLGRASKRERTVYRGLLREERHTNPNGRNPGDVWTFPTQPFTGAHFAVMPPALAERCIQAGCKPGGVVLDMFSGSGTVGLAAARHGRRYVGIDLNADFLRMSLETRLAQGSLIAEATHAEETAMEARYGDG